MELSWPFADSPDLDPSHDNRSKARRHVWLRLLSTTDIHAHLLPYDYDRDQEVTGFGLARTATLIKKARAEAPQTLLFDNGDFLQGTPLSDVLARELLAQKKCHPVIEAMNSLDYAAVNLGNHEFNFGLDWLDRTLAQAQFPVVCANVVSTMSPDNPSGDKTLRDPFVLLEVEAQDNRGNLEGLTLGVIGFVPPQVTTWDHTHLYGRVQTRDIVEAARAHVPTMRSRGADIVIALAHTGIAPGAPKPGMENAALALADVSGIDTIIAGHTHGVFPDPSLSLRRSDQWSDIDHSRGTLGDVPAVMAGYRGSHLGVLDLKLTKCAGQWRVSAHRSDARAVHPSSGAIATAEPVLSAIAHPAHRATLSRNAIALGRSDRPMHSYLARVQSCTALAPVLAAQRNALSASLAGQPEANLPILSATPAFRSGGHSGPCAYTDIPRGRLEMRHVGDLYPFPNTLIGLKLTGEDIHEWLERAASCFCTVIPGVRCQPLWDGSFAGHAFDTIAGVTYQIDLTRPARYDAEGQRRETDAKRIFDLSLNGVPLRHDQTVMLATNSFRAYGGGPYVKAKSDQVIHRDERQIKDLLVEFLKTNSHFPADVANSWSFSPIEGASVLLETGPGLRGHPKDIKQIGATDLGDNDKGFMRLDIPL